MNSRQQIQILQNIISRKGSSKILTFSMPHVFKALQMLYYEPYVSRASFCTSLYMGEGAVKTMILHLKKEGMADSTKSGTFLTQKGRRFMKNLLDNIPAECEIKKCSISIGKFNHAILLKKYAFATKSGTEQRDFAIMYGATGATTIIFRDGRFTFPNDTADCLLNDENTKKTLCNSLKPENEDMIIITSANEPFVAEISAKNSALWTMATHTR
ncbi:DUF4443 domain-containing protein [Candidatus Nitrosotenuis uzonensis]|nr:DUF4443 domain-containing protein [Candidatus Nitrosotenuis uzonensis]MCA2004000.1 DUF4443 domain-containing protein [Candidatus Nitrosotenuis sp.]